MKDWAGLTIQIRHALRDLELCASSGATQGALTHAGTIAHAGMELRRLFQDQLSPPSFCGLVSDPEGRN